ncbi:MAG: nuclear transport factor 2 family protein [Bacillota bacterium]
MLEKKTENLVREFLTALNTHDAEKAESMFSDDIVYVTSNGTFKGKQEAKRYVKWIFDTFKGFKVVESGIGVLTMENLAVAEHDISGKIDGEPANFLSMCAYEFDENGKIKALRTVFDRLTLAEQAADKWLSRKVVHSVVDKVQEGLD